MSKILLCLALCLVDAGSSKSRIRRFPPDFEFGVSTSAYQIEGAWNEDGKGPSIWDDAVHLQPSPISDNRTADVAADSYHLYKRDVEILRELGVNFYRFSISWPRILPNGFANKINQKGIDYYNNLINEMLKYNIQPFVTMYHWDLPSKLQKLGGWTNSAIVDWYKDYAKILLDTFGDRVQRWVTINEPKQICFEGYGNLHAAPLVNLSGIGEYLCAKNILLAHAEVYHMYDQDYRKLQNGTMGISISHDWFEPVSDSADDLQAAIDARQFYWGIYDHAIFSKDGDFANEVKHNVAIKSAEQGYPRSRLPEFSAAEVAFIKGSADFLGINAYTTTLTYRDASLEGMHPVPSYEDDMAAGMIKDPSWPKSAAHWLQEVPWGFYRTVQEVRRLYDNPTVYITENGWPSSGGLLDNDRIQYMKSYMSALLDAMEDGCNIKGYSVWSLYDNFEWLRGYMDKFGLYNVDYNSLEKTRTPRKSAFVYREIIRTKALDPNYEPESFTVDVLTKDSSSEEHFKESD